MTRRHQIAIAVGIVAMLLALVPPLWIQTTGDEVVLEILPVDPQSLFRGNYVDLRYDIDADTAAAAAPGGFNTPVYVVFDDARPANVVRFAASTPDLASGQTCLRGRVRGSGGIDFPALEQYFVTPEEGLRLENQLDSLVAVIKTTGSCRAILTDLEPR